MAGEGAGNWEMAGRGQSVLHVAALGAALLLAAALLTMPVLKYHALHTSFFDLGQYASLAFQAATPEGWGYALRTHAHPYLPLYALVYALWPSPATLLVIQSLGLLAGAAVFACYWRAANAGSTIWAWLVYLLALPVWYSNLFDFHFEHLLFVFIPLFFLTAGHYRGRFRPVLLVLVAAAIAAVKEPYALTAAMLGLYLCLRRREWLTGLLILALSAGYFLVVTQVVIPYFSGGDELGVLWAEAYGHLGRTPSEMAVTLAKAPLLALGTLVDDGGKIAYVAALVAGLALLPLLAPREAMVALPVLLPSLLSHNPNHYAIGHQYTAGVWAPLAVAAVVVLAAQPTVRRRNLMLAALLAAELVLVWGKGPLPLSRLFWNGKVWSYEAAAYCRTERDAAIEALIAAHIPADPDIAVSTQNTLVTTALANRRFFFAFPDGVFAPMPMLQTSDSAGSGQGTEAVSPIRQVRARYVVIDQRRPWYLKDKGCDWHWGRCQDRRQAETYEDAVRRLRDGGTTVVDRDGILIIELTGGALGPTTP